jgi:uncharacterized protein GlcG (DUF336 family)
MKILISIDKDGGSKVAVTGAPGSKCLKATEGLDKALGNMTSRHMTQEYNQTQQQGQKVKA